MLTASPYLAQRWLRRDRCSLVVRAGCERNLALFILESMFLIPLDLLCYMAFLVKEGPVVRRVCVCGWRDHFFVRELYLNRYRGMGLNETY
jgi:hypothetical protein